MKEKNEIEVKILIVKELAEMIHEYNIKFIGSISQTGESSISTENFPSKQGARFYMELILEHISEIILTPRGGVYEYRVIHNTKDPAIKKDINNFFETDYYSNILEKILKERERITDLERREKEVKIREKRLSKSSGSLVSRSFADQILNFKKIISEIGKINGSLVNLNKFEIKIITGIIEILNDQSNTDLKEENSFTGLSFRETKEGFKSPEVYISLYDLAKKITNQENPSGMDEKRVENTINDLSSLPEKRFRMEYKKEMLNEKTGEKEFYDIGIDEHLFKKLEVEKFIEKNNTRVSQGKAIVLALHNVFINNIQKSYIKIPKIKDVIQIAGTSDLSEIVQKLVWEISYAQSNKHFNKKGDKIYVYTISEKNLFEKIAPKYIERRQKSLVKPYFKEGLEMVKTLGMVTNFKESKGVQGDVLYNFTLQNVE